MELKELETKKAELINSVEGWTFRGEEEQEAPSYCYGFDFEEFKELSDDIEKGDYIKDHFDGLLYSDDTLVISW